MQSQARMNRGKSSNWPKKRFCNATLKKKKKEANSKQTRGSRLSPIFRTGPGC